jgi:hypothetical protein
MISQCTNEQITVGSTIVGGTNERRVYSVRGSTTLVVKEFRSPDNHRAQTEVAWLAQVGQLYGINGFWGTTNIPPKIVMHRQVGIPLTHTDWFLNLDRLSTADRNAVRNSVSSLVMSYALRYDALHGCVLFFFDLDSQLLLIGHLETSV